MVFLQDPTDAAWLTAHDVTSYQHMRGGTGTGAGEAAGAATGGSGAVGGAGTASSPAAAATGSPSSAAPVTPAPGGTAVKAAAASAASDPSLRATGGAGGGYIRTDEATRRILEAAEQATAATAAAAAAGGGVAGVKRPRTDISGGSDVASVGHVTAPGVRTTNEMAASFTSTGVTLKTANAAAAETDADRRERRWAGVKALKRKALLRLTTNHGPLNVELHADLVPRTVDNFMTLAKRGYYNGLKFHRLIRNFMVQVRRGGTQGVLVVVVRARMSHLHGCLPHSLAYLPACLPAGRRPHRHRQGRR